MQQASVPSRGDSKMVEKSLGLLKKSQYVTAGTVLQPHAGHLLPLGLCRSPDALKEGSQGLRNASTWVCMGMMIH